MFRHGPRFTSFFAALFLLTASAFAQTIIHLPADRPTIQAGIDAANPGDTVLVSPGLYNENIDFHGKSITVTSGASSFTGAQTTIINGAADGPVVRFATSETAGAVLNGFTVQGGHLSGNSGNSIVNAGIFISGASPFVTNNVIQRNIACGVLVDAGASPAIVDNNIRENRAPVLGELSLSGYCGDNSYAGIGLAINYAGSLTVAGNTIEDNTTSGEYSSCEEAGSAGIFLLLTNEAKLTGNTVRNNSGCNNDGLQSGEVGGGTNTLIMIQNRFYSDSSAPSNSYSGVYVSGKGSSGPPFPSLIQIGNTFGGGETLGVGFADGSVLDNNVFYQKASLQASGLNCPTGAAGQLGPVTVLYNDIFGANTSNSCVLGNGDLAVDPLFVNFPGGDLHTQPSSPIIYAGDINAPLIPRPISTARTGPSAARSTWGCTSIIRTRRSP